MGKGKLLLTSNFSFSTVFSYWWKRYPGSSPGIEKWKGRIQQRVPQGRARDGVIPHDVWAGDGSEGTEVAYKSTGKAVTILDQKSGPVLAATATTAPIPYRLIVWCLMTFSTVFQLYRGDQCTYITIVETTDSGEGGMNPIEMIVINPRKEYWPSRGLNQRPPVLKSVTLPTEL